MNAKKFFFTETEARAFYETCKGDRSIGTVRADLRAELGNYIVQYASGEDSITFTGSSMVVTLANGDKAKRSTTNLYKAVIVGYDAMGKLNVLSAHWDRQAAQDTLARFHAGKFINQNFRKLVGAPSLICA